jgi:ABC-type Fe3+-hydroxamate transport system substrate-binding protein
VTRPAIAWPLLLLSACSAGHARGASNPEFVDASGQPITLASLPVQRIVSTMQSATEWLVAMHQQQRLVARTDYDREPALASLPSIGGGLDPSPEVIASLMPDVVIGWHNSASVNLQHALRPFHIPVLSFETTDTADAFTNLRRLGVLVGDTVIADSLAQALRDSLVAVQRSACGNDTTARATVLLVLWTDPPMTAGRGTWMNTVLNAACLRNVFDDLTQPWPTVSLEAIAARQPDWILTSRGQPGQRLGELRKAPGWRELAAVQAGRVIEIPGDLFARAGPTMAGAARAIVDARRALEQTLAAPRPHSP